MSDNITRLPMPARLILRQLRETDDTAAALDLLEAYASASFAAGRLQGAEDAYAVLEKANAL